METGPRSAKSCVQVPRLQSKTALSRDQSQPATVTLHLAAVCDKPIWSYPGGCGLRVGDLCLPLQATRRTPSLSGCPGPTQTPGPRTRLHVNHTCFQSFATSDKGFFCFHPTALRSDLLRTPDLRPRNDPSLFLQASDAAPTAQCFAGWRR